MYEQYLTYHHIPCGAILDRIITKEHLSQRELALRSEIPYQRINDFIANRRRISPENSLKLERALGVEYQCFFYQIQTNHEIYLATMRFSEKLQPDMSKYRKTLFWDTDSSTLDWQRNSEWIIRRVFEYGNQSEIEETIRFYGKTKIINILQGIKDSWNLQNRNDNAEKYLSYEFED
ncbi:MAG: helix-turn-helix domain-containing protein [Bacteroidia bacterium]|nr:helix-turn-helix domain-containing protein [Bacteroidia bacterium]